MNSLLSPITDAELNRCGVCAEIATMDNTYATAPMRIVGKSTIQPRLDEEEVYSSFEQAISGRQEVVQHKLRSLSSSSLHVARKTTNSRAVPMPRTVVFAINRQNLLFLSVFAFIFTLLGFDIMGLLILLVR